MGAPQSARCSQSIELLRGEEEGETRSLSRQKTFADEYNAIIDDANTWHPAFLQTRTLYTFIFIFIVLAIALETIFLISNQRQGLAESFSGLHYLWTFGPAAIMTLIAALWACVDFSARVATPWIREIKSEADLKAALLIDYVSMNSFCIPFYALRGRDVYLSAVTLVSLILTMLIVIAPSLIQLDDIQTRITARAQTEFVDDPSRLAEPGLLPLYEVVGHQRFGLPLPEGMSHQFVYQSVQPSTSEVRDLRATVEGISLQLHCERAVVTSFTGVPPQEADDENVYATMTLSTTDCDFMAPDQTVLFSPDWMALNETTGWLAGSFASTGQIVTGQCQNYSSSLDNYRVAWLIANVSLTKVDDEILDMPNGSKYSLALQNSQQLICKPEYNLSGVNIQENRGIVQEVSLAQTQRVRKFPNLHAWHIVEAMFNAYTLDSSPFIAGYVWVLTGTGGRYLHLAEFWDDMSRSILLMSQDIFPNISAVDTFTLLKTSFESYFRIHGLFLLHRALVAVSKENDVVGQAHIQRNRLVVQTLACQVLVGLCVLVSLLLVVGWRFRSTCRSLPENPSSIIGLIALSKHIGLRFPKLLGASQMGKWKAEVHKWNAFRQDVTDDSSEHSVDRKEQLSNDKLIENPVLRFQSNKRLIPRIGMGFFIISIIILLEVLSRVSNSNNGLGSTKDHSYIHYVWVLSPTLILSAIGIFFSSLDLEFRNLVPFQALIRDPVSAECSINMRFRDTILPHALYKELKMRHFAAAMTTFTGFFASLLTVTSGSLFSGQATPLILSAQLRLVGSFSSKMFADNFHVDNDRAGGGIKSTLVLESNMSYPAFTFEDIAIPVLALEDENGMPATSLQDHGSQLEVRVAVPALRAGLSCRRQQQSDISVDILHVEESQNLLDVHGEHVIAGDFVRVNITGEFCYNSSLYSQVLSPDMWATALFPTHGLSHGVFGGTVGFMNHVNILAPCSNFIYVWGNFSSIDTGEAPTSFVASALSCNASVEALDVDVTFYGYDLAINPGRPPQPIAETTPEIIPAANSTYQFGDAGVYNDIFSLPPPNNTVFDGFFAALTTSKYALPGYVLSDPLQVDAVEAAITFQHKMMVAQILSSSARIPVWYESLNDHGVFAYKSKDDFNGGIVQSNGAINVTTYAAVVTNTQGGPYRVLQDVKTTRIIQSLLVAILILSVLGLLFGPSMAVVPRPVTCVASVLALLVDGNLYDALGSQVKDRGEAADLSNAEIRTILGGNYRFKLGTGPSEVADGTCGDDRHRYAIWVSESD